MQKHGELIQPRRYRAASSIAQSARFTLRMFVRNRLFYSLVIGTLALGIGTATAMLTALNQLVLQRLPVKDQDRIVVAFRSDVQKKADNLPFTEELLDSYGRESSSYSLVGSMGFSGAQNWSVRMNDEAFFAQGLIVSGNFFEVLGVSAWKGRTLRASDDVLGADPVVVISTQLARRIFGGVGNGLGQRLTFAGRAHSVIGILADGFELPSKVEMWLPRIDAVPPGKQVRADFPFLALVARVRPGIGVGGAQSEFDAFLSRRSQERPDSLPNARSDWHEFSEFVLGDTRALVYGMSVAGLLLLGIAGTNAINLLLIRGVSRQHEWSVRNAIGASRERLLLQLLTEGSIIGMLSGAIGLVLAVGMLAMLRFVAPEGLTHVQELHLDSVAALSAVVLAVIVGALCGAAQILATMSGDIAARLRSGGRNSSSGRAAQWGRKGLVIGQVSLTLIVLTASLVLTETLFSLQRQPLGFDPEPVTTMDVVVSTVKYNSAAKYLDLLDQILPALRGLPGVTAVAATSAPPLLGNVGWRAGVAQERNANVSEDKPMVDVTAIGPDYFKTLAIRQVTGRDISAADRENSTAIVVLSESIAQKLWSSESAIGKRIRLDAQGLRDTAWREVVGVVAENRYRDISQIRPTAYVPYRQINLLPTHLLVRANTHGVPLAKTVLNKARETEQDFWFAASASLQDRMAGPLARPRFNAILFLGFAATSLVLAQLGLYGVISAMMRERRRELTLRMALGASGSAIHVLVLREGAIMLGLGAAAGVAGSWGGIRLLQTIATDVQPAHFSVLVAGVTVILLSGLVACAIPANRATKANIVEVLHVE